MVHSHSKLMDETNRVGVQYLLVEVQTGLTFLSVADTTERRENRARNLQNALKVYQTVQRLLPQVVPLPSERMELDSRMEELKLRLSKAGIFTDS